VTQQDLIELVNRYFSAVDGQDIETIKDTLAPNCIFTVETHGIRLEGHAQIERMFDRLWTSHAGVKHHDFVYIASSEDGRIATRFQVVNTHHDGQLTHKSNCNFFEVFNGQFISVAVYMAGQNTLNSD
jgi:ketosteroid isomerase-like protein